MFHTLPPGRLRLILRRWAKALGAQKRRLMTLWLRGSEAVNHFIDRPLRRGGSVPVFVRLSRRTRPAIEGLEDRNLPNNFIGPSLSELALIGPVASLSRPASAGDLSLIPAHNDQTAFISNSHDVALRDAVFSAITEQTAASFASDSDIVNTEDASFREMPSEGKQRPADAGLFVQGAATDPLADTLTNPELTAGQLRKEQGSAGKLPDLASPNNAQAAASGGQGSPGGSSTGNGGGGGGTPPGGELALLRPRSLRQSPSPTKEPSLPR